MNPDEVVVHAVDRQGCQMVFDLLGERIGESRKAAVMHSQGKVLPFDIAGADVLRIGHPLDGFLFDAEALRRTVALLAFGVVAVDFDEHRIIDVLTERGLHGCEVSLQAIAGKLHAIGETARKVFHEGSRRVRVALANHERWNQLRVRVNGDPSPNIARVLAIREMFRLDVLLFGVHETPDFIDLKTLAGQVHQRLFHVVRAGRSEFYQQFRNCVLGNSGHAYRRTNRTALNQTINNLSLLSGMQPVHMTNIAALKKKVN